MPTLSGKQKHDIAIDLTTLILAGLDGEDCNQPLDSFKYERMLVRAFACFFACNNTTVAADEQEAKELCESLNVAFYAGFDDRQKELNQQLQERFTAYHEATDYLGKEAPVLVPVTLEHLEGSLPLDAFVVFEKAFFSFVCAPEDDVDTDALFRTTLSKDPMRSTFAYFLRVWERAEKSIRKTADSAA